MFDGVIANAQGEGLNEPSRELIDLLSACPTNRSGWHYLQQVIDGETYTFHLHYFDIGDMALKVNGFYVYDSRHMRGHLFPQNHMIRPHRLDDGELILINGVICARLDTSYNDALIARLLCEHPGADPQLVGYLARIIELLDIDMFFDGEYTVTSQDLLEDLIALYPRDVPINNSLASQLQAALR